MNTNTHCLIVIQQKLSEMVMALILENRNLSAIYVGHISWSMARIGTLSKRNEND
nr:hypothetical protein [Catalinimonas alkaloidigena]